VTTFAAERCDIYFDECTTYWIRAEGKTRWQAAKLVRDLEGDLYRPVSSFGVRVVRGVEHERHGEEWFTPTGQGERFYEVEAIEV
jgi:hypothetical protein